MIDEPPDRLHLTSCLRTPPKREDKMCYPVEISQAFLTIHYGKGEIDSPVD